MYQFEVVFKPKDKHVKVRLISHSSVTSQNKDTYFTKISAKDREKVKKWLLENQKGNTKLEEGFLAILEEAIQVVDYDYWIASLEPSESDGKIYYAEGHTAAVGFSNKEWAHMAKKYAPERGSRLSTLYELLIWYALRIVNGLWTLYYVDKDSSSAGNYWNAPKSSKEREKTGARKCGGYADGQGNTYKIVTHEKGFVHVGGAYNFDGRECPVDEIHYEKHQHNNIRNQGTGVLVLTK